MKLRCFFVVFFNQTGMPGSNLFLPPPGSLGERTSSAAGMTQSKAFPSSWHLFQPEHYVPLGPFQIPSAWRKCENANSFLLKAAPNRKDMNSTKS